MPSLEVLWHTGSCSDDKPLHPLRGILSPSPRGGGGGTFGAVTYNDRVQGCAPPPAVESES